MRIMPVIYHMADIHVTNYNDRYDEFEEIFKKIYKILEDDKREKIIIIGGDLFDNKLTMKTYTLTFVSLFISNLVKYGELIIFDGNHDMNMVNDKVESTISSMLTLPKKLNINGIERIHYLNENKIYKIKGINFGLTTMFTKEVTKIENKKVDEVYVGLYHGKVYGAKTDLEYKINENNCYFRTTDFKDYDIVCLGDIHKHQFLDTNKRIAYSSSLIQKDFGETVNNHGLIIWDLNKLEGIFTPIKNGYCMINCKVENKRLIIHEEINLEDYKYIKAKITYKKEEIKDIEKFESKLRKKFNFKEITFYEEVIINEDNELNARIDDNMKKVFDEYILNSKNEEEDKNDMKRIIYNIIDENNLDIERNMKKIELCSLEFKNLFCYGENNIINFSKLNKIVGIVADNGWGKSSIIDALLYTIYQKCARTKGTRVLNKFKNKSLSILSFKINDIPYDIKRSILKLKNKNEEILEIKKNGVNINSDYKKNTNQMIEELFGSYEELTDNNIILQNSNNFINKTEKEKKDIMYKIFGIEAYDKLNQIINNKILQLKKELDKENKKVLEIEEDTKIKESIKNKSVELEEINKEYQKICDIISNQNYSNIQLKNIIGNQTDINDINKEYKECLLQLKNNNNELKNYHNQFNIKAIDNENLDEIYKKLEIDRNKLDNIQNTVTNEKLKKKNIIQIDDIINKIKILESNKIKIKEISNKIKLLNKKESNKKIFEIREELKKAKEIIIEYEYSKKILEEYKEENKDLLDHKFNDTCMECNHNKKIHERINYIQKINDLSKFIIKNTNINDIILKLENEISIKEELNELSEDIKNIENENKNINELIRINNKNKEHEKENEKIEIEVKKIENEYDNLNKNYKNRLMKFNELKGLVNINNKLNDKKMDLQKIKLNWKNNELEICKLKEIILNQEENIKNRKELEKKIKELEKEIILLELKLDENINKIKEILLLRKEVNRYNNISKLFTEERLIERLLTQIIDNTEKIINNVLKDLTNFSLKFELNREGISIYKSYNEELIDAKFLSGYEMFVTNIALRIAFGKLNRYIKTNFMIIDEGFASCSNTNIVKINNVFDIIRKYYKWCIVVSHLDQIKNNFDNSYNITKVDKTNDSLIIIN